jgi:hypothetical protein
MGQQAVISFEMSGGGGSPRQRIFWHANTSISLTGSDAASAAGRLAAVSAGASDLRLYRNGAQDGTTLTTTRSEPTGANLLRIGLFSGEANGTKAAHTASIHSTAALTPEQIAATTATLRAFFVEIGRPPCE